MSENSGFFSPGNPTCKFMKTLVLQMEQVTYSDFCYSKLTESVIYQEQMISIIL